MFVEFETTTDGTKFSVNPRFVRYVFPCKAGGTFISFEGSSETEVEFTVSKDYESVMYLLRRTEPDA